MNSSHSGNHLQAYSYNILLQTCTYNGFGNALLPLLKIQNHSTARQYPNYCRNLVTNYYTIWYNNDIANLFACVSG